MDKQASKTVYRSVGCNEDVVFTKRVIDYVPLHGEELKLVATAFANEGIDEMDEDEEVQLFTLT